MTGPARRVWIEARPAPTPPRALPGYDPLAAIAARGADTHPVYDVIKGVGMSLVEQGLTEAEAKHGGELKNGALTKVMAGVGMLQPLKEFERAKHQAVTVDVNIGHDQRALEMNAALQGYLKGG